MGSGHAIVDWLILGKICGILSHVSVTQGATTTMGIAIDALATDPFFFTNGAFP